MAKRNAYINGTEVRQLQAAPAREPQVDPGREAEERRRRSRQNAARRNRQRALYMSKGYVAFLTLCVMLGAGFSVTYVKLQADITHRMRRIAALESQISDLRADNDANYKRIVTSVDLNHIRDVAMNQMGMTYATEDQIVYFSVDNANYMDQYVDIPSK